MLWPGVNSQEWDDFVTLSSQGSVFCRSWWLNAVAPGRHAVLVLRNDGRIVAGMPLTWTGPKPFETICMPLLTQTLGVLLEPPRSPIYARNLANEMEMMERLIEALPPFRELTIQCNYRFMNWLPFYWAEFSQTTRYTYVLHDLTNLDAVFAAFAHAKRKNIRKAERVVSVHRDLSCDEFYDNHVLTLRKQGEKIAYDHALFKRIYEAAYQNNSGRSWYAIDADRNIHAAIFVIWDPKSAYYLISSIDPDFRNSGAATLLIRDCIAHVAGFTSKFDFEGSMIRGVERSFRNLGGIQAPYFRIAKDNRSPWAKLCSKASRLVSQYVRRGREVEE
jgi:hypothetical protein